MNIIGISAFYHDSAACLIQDGAIVYAAQEERFTRKKHDNQFPVNAINACLDHSKLSINDIDFVSFYDKPFLKFDRILSTYLAYAPFGIKSFFKAMPQWIKQKFWIKEMIRKDLNYEGKILFSGHHESHAASAFFPSPFKKAAFLTVDGVGEWATMSYGVGIDNNIEIIADLKFPHSLGLLYSAFTYYTGFRVNSGEYKVMGLAPYGEPKYKDIILEELIDLKDDGSFKMNMKYFGYGSGLAMTNENFNDLFGGSPRMPESDISQKEMDIARSIQEVTEEIILRIARFIRKETEMEYLCLAGGVALNCVANGKLLRENIFKDIYIQPAAGDAGGALGTALIVWHQYLKNHREIDEKIDYMMGAFLGTEYKDSEVKQFLDDSNITYRELRQDKLPEVVADLIAEEKVIGWFQGRMEFGPRALGARSIIGDARSPQMQETMNLKIKYRESFRPFAPSVLVEKAGEYFDIDRPSPYMLFVAKVKDSKMKDVETNTKNLSGLERLKVARSDIPAVTHLDYSARIQSVDKKTNPLYHSVISKFDEKYDCPVIVNTSFNVRGEPIVHSPKDAYLCFMRTEMDYLVMGNFLLNKIDQKELADDIDWRKEFELD